MVHSHFTKFSKNSIYDFKLQYIKISKLNAEIRVALSKNYHAKVSSITNFSTPNGLNEWKLHVNKGFPSWMGLALDLFLALSWKAQKLSSHTLFVERFARVEHCLAFFENVNNLTQVSYSIYSSYTFSVKSQHS